MERASFSLIFREKYNTQLEEQFGNVGRYFMDRPVIPAAKFYPSVFLLYIKRRTFK